MLRKRVITALWGIPLLIAAIWFEQPLPWFTVLIAIWGMLAFHEFYRLVAGSRKLPFPYSELVLTLLFIISRNAELLDVIESDFLVIFIPTILLFSSLEPLIWHWIFPHWYKGISFFKVVLITVGILYAGWLLGHLVALRGLEDGRNWVFFALFITFASDTAAFFVGRALGRHKLAPAISPGKTWEGAIGGVLGAIIVSLFFTLNTTFVLPLSWGQAVILGLLVSIFGQLGDLTESLFKRYTGVKDSGSVLPGHGGFLDRMDSVVFAGAVVYYYVVWVIQ